MKASLPKNVRRELAVLTGATLLVLLGLVAWAYLLPLRDPKPLRTLQNNNGNICDIEFSPQETMIASAGKTIALNDWRTGALIRNLGLGKSSPLSIAFSPDGKILAGGYMDATIKIWNPETGQLLKTLEGHSAPPNVAYSPDGKTLASGSWNKSMTTSELKLWDAATGKLKLNLPSQKSGVADVCFSPDSKKLVTGEADGTLKVWDVESGDVKQIQSGLGQLMAVAYSPDGRFIACGGRRQVVSLWDAQYLGLVREWKFEEDEDAEVRSIAFSPDSRHIAIAASRTSVRVLETNTGVLEHTFKGQGRNSLMFATAFSPDGHVVASGGMIRSLHLWRIP